MQTPDPCLKESGFFFLKTTVWEWVVIPTCCFSHAIVMCQAEDYNKSGGSVTTTPQLGNWLQELTMGFTLPEQGQQVKQQHHALCTHLHN
jgi:hypothetical protein